MPLKCLSAVLFPVVPLLFKAAINISLRQFFLKKLNFNIYLSLFIKQRIIVDLNKKYPWYKTHGTNSLLQRHIFVNILIHHFLCV